MKTKSYPLNQPVALQKEDNDGRTVIRSVVIAQSGVDKQGDYFSTEFLQDLVKQGNESESGIKSRFGHPNMCKTTLGSVIGRYRDFAFVEGKDGSRSYVTADLHLAQISKATQVEGRGISMHDYIVKLAQEDYDLFGNSIVFRGERKEEEIDLGGEAGVQITPVLYLSKFMESDLVDSPSATTNLFKGEDDLGLIVGAFLDDHGDELFKTLETKPEAVDIYLRRYFSYKGKKPNMKLLKQLKEILTGSTTDQKDFEVTTDTGVILTIVTDEDRTTPVVGDPVQDSDGNPVEDGDQTLQDGSTLTIEGGEITAIAEAEEDGDGEGEGEGEGDGDGETVSQEEIQRAITEGISKGLAPILERMEAMEKENEESFKFLAKHIKSGGIELPKPGAKKPGANVKDVRRPSGYKGGE